MYTTQVFYEDTEEFTTFNSIKRARKYLKWLGLKPSICHPFDAVALILFNDGVIECYE